LVLERIFTLLTNLDSGPGARQDSMSAKPDLLSQQSALGKARAVRCLLVTAIRQPS
jgi:hypothetical protein